MKILHIVWVLSEANGIFQAITNLTVEQRRLGHDVRIVNLYKNGDEIDDVQLITAEDMLKTTIETFRPDIGTINGIFFKEFFFVGMLMKRLKIPYLIAFHGSFSRANYKKHTLRKFFYKHLVFSPIVKDAANVIFLSESERRNSVVRNCKVNPLVIPNGCFLPEIEKKQPPSERAIEIIYIGRMDIYGKGIDVLNEGIELLKQRAKTVDFRIRLYGQHSGSSEKWIAEHIATDDNPIISYEGPVFGPAKDLALKRSDIMILPSRSEGFPMSILEALSYGLPCIVTAETNVADIIKQNECGWTTALSAQDIANSIVKACNQYRSNSDNLIRNSRQTAANFTWPQIAIKTLSHYIQIVSR